MQYFRPYSPCLGGPFIFQFVRFVQSEPGERLTLKFLMCMLRIVFAT